MKILVLGATGATGRLVLDQALAAGHQVRALVRSPEKLTVSSPNPEVVTGQATDDADVAQALSGVDAVISALGAAKGSVITDATRALIAGTEGVKRVIIMSSFAVLTDRLSGPAKAPPFWCVRRCHGRESTNKRAHGGQPAAAPMRLANRAQPRDTSSVPARSSSDSGHAAMVQEKVPSRHMATAVIAFSTRPASQYCIPCWTRSPPPSNLVVALTIIGAAAGEHNFE